MSLKKKGRCSCVHRGGIIKEECRSLYTGETKAPNAGEDCLTVTFFSSFLRLKDQRMSNVFFLFTMCFSPFLFGFKNPFLSVGNIKFPLLLCCITPSSVGKTTQALSEHSQAGDNNSAIRPDTTSDYFYC